MVITGRAFGTDGPPNIICIRTKGVRDGEQLSNVYKGQTENLILNWKNEY